MRRSETRTPSYYLPHRTPQDMRLPEGGNIYSNNILRKLDWRRYMGMTARADHYINIPSTV